MKFRLVVVLFLLTDTAAKFLSTSLEEDVSEAVSTVLEATSQPSCSLIFFRDAATSPSTILKAVNSERSSPRGVTVMEVTADGQDANATLELLSHLVGQARRIRLGSWCVRVVVVSHDPAFLASFAESSLEGRLLVWATRLVVVTSLTLPQLHTLLPTHWTFFMMNSIFLNVENQTASVKVKAYSHIPYSPSGAQLVQVASWSRERGLIPFKKFNLFPEKFEDFQGATIPVSVLPFPPHWVEEQQQADNGTTVKSYSGIDGEMLHSVARALNFSFHVLPASNWIEVMDMVRERKSLVSPVVYKVLPELVDQHDVTWTYDYIFMVFSMKKPGLKPSWQSLYYPMADQVWAAVLALLICVPVILIMVIRADERREGGSWIGSGAVVQDITGMLLGQNLPRRLPSTHSSRLLVAAWLVFAFIIGTIYRGNLTAHLTLPKYPPRPETVEQLVNTVDKVPRPGYGAIFKESLLISDNNVLQKLGELVVLGTSIMDGFKQALELNQAVVEIRRYLQYVIAESFSRQDGSTDLYIGQEPILTLLAAWLVTLDAPYRPQFDRCMMAVVEAGLYGKWGNDEIVKARLKSSRRQRENMDQQQQQESTESDSSIRALTLKHMQGPLMLLLLGLTFSGITFIVEIFMIRSLP